MTKDISAAIDAYAIIILPVPADAGGGFVAHAPDLQGCMGDGDTPELAVTDLRRAMVEWMGGYRALGRDIPPPGSRARDLYHAPESYWDYGDVDCATITACRAKMSARFGIGQGRMVAIDDPFQNP